MAHGIARLRFPSLLAFAGLAVMIAASPLRGQALNGTPDERMLRHESPEWALIEPHLPDPQTATPAALELEGDVLHARRFDEDALEFYQYALTRGGDESELRNRIGILQLDMKQPELARASFRRVLALHPRQAAGWNNLGAAEYLMSSYKPAVEDYRRAVRFEKRNAIFHANLGTAYFEIKDYESAEAQFQAAARLDRGVFQRAPGNGPEAHVLSATDRGRFCFALAKVSATQHDETGMLSWLTKASEVGFDIRAEMTDSRSLGHYVNDPRVLLIVHNAHALRLGHMVASGPPPPLPPA